MAPGPWASRTSQRKPAWAQAPGSADTPLWSSCAVGRILARVLAENFREKISSENSLLPGAGAALSWQELDMRQRQGGAALPGPPARAPSQGPALDSERRFPIPEGLLRGHPQQGCIPHPLLHQPRAWTLLDNTMVTQG